MLDRWSLRFLSLRVGGGAVIMRLWWGFCEVCTGTLEGAGSKCGDEDDVSCGYAGEGFSREGEYG